MNNKIFIIPIILFFVISGLIAYMALPKEINPENKWIHSIELKVEEMQLKSAKEKEPLLYKQVKERYNEFQKSDSKLSKETSNRLIESLQDYMEVSKHQDHLYDAMLMYQDLYKDGFITQPQWDQIQMDYLKKVDPIK